MSFALAPGMTHQLVKSPLCMMPLFLCDVDILSLDFASSFLVCLLIRILLRLQLGGVHARSLLVHVITDVRPVLDAGFQLYTSLLTTGAAGVAVIGVFLAISVYNYSVLCVMVFPPISQCNNFSPKLLLAVPPPPRRAILSNDHLHTNQQHLSA